MSICILKWEPDFDSTHYIPNSCCCWVAKPCLTLCDHTDCSMPGFPVLHYFPEFAQTKSIVSMMPSNPLTLCHPILLLPSIFPNSSVHISSDLIMISCKYFSHCWPWLINGITNSICKKGNRLGYKISEYNTHSKAKNCFLKLLIHFTCNNIKFIAKYGLQKKKKKVWTLLLECICPQLLLLPKPCQSENSIKITHKNEKWS